MNDRINERQKLRIIGLRESDPNISICSISRTVGVSRKTVRLWINRYANEGSIQCHHNIRPRVTTHEQDDLLHGNARNTRFTTARQLALDCGLNVSNNTIRRRLKERGIKAYIAAKKDFLTARHREIRLNFANELLENRTIEYWESLWYSDEKSFGSHEHGKVYVYRERNTRYDPANIYTVKKSGRINENVWGVFNSRGHALLLRINGHLNQDIYRDEILPQFLAFARERQPDGPINFMQDNCPVHRSNSVNNWFQNHPAINILRWPAKAQDINPIENVWGAMVKSLGNNNANISNKDQLWNRIQLIWDRFFINNIQARKFAMSVPNGRLPDVIAKQGGWTKY